MMKIVFFAIVHIHIYSNHAFQKYKRSDKKFKTLIEKNLLCTRSNLNPVRRNVSTHKSHLVFVSRRKIIGNYFIILGTFIVILLFN